MLGFKRVYRITGAMVKYRDPVRVPVLHYKKW
jgi:hypothetical protein